MSQDVINRDKSNTKMPIQIQGKSGKNKQRIRVLTPEVLNHIKFVDTVEVCESEQKKDDRIGTVSPIKTQNSMKKMVARKVLKSSDSSKIESHSPVRNIGKNQRLEETLKRKEIKYKSSTTERLKNEVVPGPTQIITGHKILSRTSDTGREIPDNAQSEKSTGNHKICQIFDELQTQKKPEAKRQSEKSSSKQGRSSSGLETLQRNKSPRSSSSKIIPSSEFSQPKITEMFNKMVSTSTSPVMQHNQIIKKDRNTEMLNGVKTSHVALLERESGSSLKLTSSSSYINTSHEDETITRKEKLSLSKDQHDVTVGVKAKKPASLEPQHISQSQMFNTPHSDTAADRKSERSHTAKQSDMDVDKNSRAKSKKNISKIENDNMNNSHDNIQRKSEKNGVLEDVGVTQLPGLIPITESSTIEKIRRTQSKNLITHQSLESNSVNLDNKFSTIPRSNGIDKNDVTKNCDGIGSTRKIEITKEQTNNGEECIEPTKEKESEQNNSNAEISTGNPVRKRGRPRKNCVDDLSQSNSIDQKAGNASSVTLEANGIEIDPTTPELGRSRRINKNAEIKEKLSDEESNTEKSEEEEDNKKRTQRRRQGGKRGRRRGKQSTRTVDTDYKPRSVESNSKPKKSEINEEKWYSIEIVCGRCTEKMTRDKWGNHNLQKHNNMGWLEGDKVPDYENDEKLWRSILSTAHKRKKGTLICDKCSVTKKSVFGFISHYKFCGKTDEQREAMKWICPQCKGVFMPSSQDFHERWHRNVENQEKNSILQSLANNGEVVGSRKRKAAEKAATKISEFTALVKDEEPVAKKSRKNGKSLRDLIEQTSKKKSIPAAWKSTWMKAIAAKELAQCQQPGCTFSTSVLSEITEHYDNCKFKPSPTLTCKVCKYISTVMDDMEKHVKDEHSNEIKGGEDSDFLASESSDESVDGEILTKPPMHRKPTSTQMTPREKSNKYEGRVSFLRNESRRYEGNPKMTFVSALRWTLEFEYENYCSLVFENLKPNQSTLLTHNNAKNHLPELTVSMRMQHLKDPVTKPEEIKKKIANIEWKTWNRFESSVVNGFPTFFVGGPVWSMAWLPIPTQLYSHNVNQYVAVSTHSKMHDSFASGKSYKFKNIIQIWNLGDLNHSLSHTLQNPELVYAIAHENGTIWCMEWCPSGAYENSYATNDEENRNSNPRMGLLAVAASDGCVHIYSTTFPETLNFKKDEESQLPIYKTDPVVTLQFNQLYHEKEDINWQCTTLNWSKMDSHDIIAAGFSNGYVALWDLSTKSPLLVTKNNDTLYITSYRYFFAHRQSVSGITIIPLQGRRFLATVSVDRFAKFWDLEDLSDCVSSVKKGMTVNSTWMTHWPNIIAAYDDVIGVGHTTSSIIGSRESCSKAFPLLPTNSPCFGIAASDYANGVCHGTSAGELVAIFPLQMFYYRDLEREKLNRKRWLVSSVEVVDFEEKSPADDCEKKEEKEKKDKKDKKSKLKEYVYMPDSYEECNKRFGLVFHNDINNLKKKTMKKSDRKSPLNAETMKMVPIEQYNFASINRIAWNPNAWSYLWLAVGYQNGLIRVLHLKSMSMQNAISELLPRHLKKLLEKENVKQSASSM